MSCYAAGHCDNNVDIPRNSLHGQRWAQHQRIPVLCLHRQDSVAGWEARGVRPGGGGDGRRQEDREFWLSVGKDQQEDCGG